jgi:flagellar basal-body rod protein FlgC
MVKIPGEGATGVAVSALHAQQARMRVIAENIANQASTGRTPGADPYRRQVPVFAPALTKDGAEGVAMIEAKPDPKAFPLLYEPGNPAANAQGYVKGSNVSGMIEALDMKAAQRAYSANLNMLENLDAMEKRTLDILKP